MRGLLDPRCIVYKTCGSYTLLLIHELPRPRRAHNACKPTPPGRTPPQSARLRRLISLQQVATSSLAPSTSSIPVLNMATPRNNESIWSRGGAASGRAWSSNTTTARGGEVGSSGSSRGSWRGGRGGGGSRNDSIHAGGFRKAVGEVGRKPGEMEMLLSPSRGIEDDATRCVGDAARRSHLRS